MAVIDIAQVQVEQEVPFGKGGSRELLCDVYRPAGASTKRTAVVHLHGGGFTRGTKAGVRLARPLASLGYTCVSSQYRLADEAHWPSQVQDVKACIRWIRANAARLEVEPDRIVVLGYSAGGNLALSAAGTQNEPDMEGEGGNPGAGTAVAACIAFYPGIEARLGSPLMGPSATEEQARRASPINLVRPGFPPTMVLHGTADLTIPVESSLRLYQALRDARVPVELHVVEGVTHIFDTHPEFAEASAQWIDLFLDRHVVNPRTLPSTEPGAR